MISTKDRFGQFDTPRRLRALGSGYTWFVRILRLALPLLALVLIGLVIARLATDPQKATLTTADLPQDEKTVPGQIEMVAAKYQGVDGEGRAYTITADTASRDMQNQNTVLLQNPAGDIIMPDGSALSVRAQHGRYDTATTDMQLSQDVVLTHGDGYEMQLQSLAGNIKAREAITRDPVHIKGPAGTLHAQGMDIQDTGMMIVFQGPVQMTLYNLGKGQPG